MAKISITYDSETGEFETMVDGAAMPNVTGVTVNVPPGYDDDNDDEYGPGVYCNITTVERQGDVSKCTHYSIADEQSKAAIADGLARPSEIPGLIEQLYLEQSIDNFLHSKQR